jgi:hypothetical protein
LFSRMMVPRTGSVEESDADETSSEHEDEYDADGALIYRGDMAVGELDEPKDADGKGGSVCVHGKRKHMCRECTEPPVK